MGQQYGPKIVTDGLVLHWDAANIRSYPGSGTTVYDLSGNGKNGTLSGGTAYDTDGGGSFYFDGVNDLISFGVGSDLFPLYNFSVDVWFSSDGTTATTGTSPALFGLTYGLRLFVNIDRLWVGVDNGTSIESFLGPTGYSFHDSSWHNVVATGNNGTIDMYIDGNAVMTSSISSWSGNTRWPTNSINFGRDNNNTMYYFRGNMAPIKIYNTKLTQSQITQNFNAIRGRFGI